MIKLCFKTTMVLICAAIAGCSNPATEKDIQKALMKCPDLKPILEKDATAKLIEKNELVKMTQECLDSKQLAEETRKHIVETQKNNVTADDQAKALGIAKEDAAPVL